MQCAQSAEAADACVAERLEAASVAVDVAAAASTELVADTAVADTAFALAEFAAEHRLSLHARFALAFVASAAVAASTAVADESDSAMALQIRYETRRKTTSRA